MAAQTPRDAFDGAARYSALALQNYGHLAAFVRRRTEIEEEYARALRKLCRSVSLVPHEQEQAAAEEARRIAKKSRPGFWARLLGRRGKVDQEPAAEATPAASHLPTATQSEVWKAFFALVDDTAQLAKAHAALADSLAAQVSEPLAAAIAETATGRRASVAEGAALSAELDTSTAALTRAMAAYQAAVAAAGRARVALDDAERHLAPPGSAPLGDEVGRRLAQQSRAAAARERLRRAEDAAVKARQDVRILEDAHRALHARVHAQDMPRLLGRMHALEAGRLRDVLGHMVALVELERRCTAMDDAAANEMAARVRAVDVSADERAYVAAFLSAPLPPPPAPLLPSQPSASALFPVLQPPEVVSALPGSDAAAKGARPGTPLGLADADFPRSAAAPPAYASRDHSAEAVEASRCGPVDVPLPA